MSIVEIQMMSCLLIKKDVHKLDNSKVGKILDKKNVAFDICVCICFLAIHNPTKGLKMLQYSE